MLGRGSLSSAHLSPRPGAAGRSGRGHSGCLRRCGGPGGRLGEMPGYGGSVTAEQRSGDARRGRAARGRLVLT
jgi:hypothetical protein